MSIPDWLKVKTAALLGIGTSTVHLDGLVGWLDLAIKFGQLGVAAVTILYIAAKWREIRNKRK